MRHQRNRSVNVDNRVLWLIVSQSVRGVLVVVAVVMVAASRRLDDTTNAHCETDGDQQFWECVSHVSSPISFLSASNRSFTHCTSSERTSRIFSSRMVA